MSAALARLCLVDDPVPTELDTLLDQTATGPLAGLLAPVPWLLDAHPENGLHTVLTQMRNPDDYAWIASTY
ncbi:hypothetical protein ACFV1L_13165 [Kitasatospora sp. NPDC059646]|uniref:hypothetical protein n=1 Tax=Kitasatospora sp. NPDC059646 TaxID=3346893 RepID=UPI00368B61D1